MLSLLNSWRGENAWSLLKGKMGLREHGSWVPVTLKGESHGNERWQGTTLFPVHFLQVLGQMKETDITL